MKHLRLASLIFIIIIAFVSCNESSTLPIDLVEPPEPIDEGEFNIITHGEVTESQKNSIRDSLITNSARIMSHLTVAAMNVITVEVWAASNSSSFYNAMQNRIGQIYPGATGFTPSLNEMFMLYSSTTPTECVHEYAHLVSLKLNPTISNNPRWLWEAVAQYESRMYSHPSTWNQANLEFPGFSAVDQYNSVLPYRWGYFISACTIENWGNDKFVELIKHNGDINNVLKITPSEFGNMVEIYVRSMISIL